MGPLATRVAPRLYALGVVLITLISVATFYVEARLHWLQSGPAGETECYLIAAREGIWEFVIAQFLVNLAVFTLVRRPFVAQVAAVGFLSLLLVQIGVAAVDWCRRASVSFTDAMDIDMSGLLFVLLELVYIALFLGWAGMAALIRRLWRPAPACSAS